MAKASVVVSEQQAAELIAADAGIHIDGQGNISSADPGRAPGRMRDPNFEQKMANLNNRIRVMGVLPATIFNFLPITLVVNSPMQAVQGGVPAAKGKAPFATRTWDELAIMPFLNGDAGREPHEFHPMQVAEAFVHEFPHGGVLALFGGSDAADKPENAEKVKAATAQAIAWMRRKVLEGDNKWNAADRMQRQLVNFDHRACAQRLFDIGVLKKLPDWVNPTTDQAEVMPEACGKCGKTPENRNMLQCPCGWVLDPERAFKKGIISEEDESLERLTREQAIKLGVSAYVAETVDEKPARIKAGIPKPFSEAYMRADAAARAANQSQQA